jgi:hypothetical protein
MFLLVLILPSCQLLDLGYLDDSLSQNDQPIPVEYSSTAAALARESILSAYPQGSELFVDSLATLLPGQNLVQAMINHDAIDAGAIPNECPFLEAPSGGVSVECTKLLTLASEATKLTKSSIASSVLSQTLSARSVSSGESAFVAAWTNEALSSGIITGAIKATDVMRSLNICDEGSSAADRAYALGISQGRVIFRNTYEEMLPQLPRTQCNTDILATSILAQARAMADEYNQGNRICAQYTEADFGEDVDINAMDIQRGLGVDEGLETEYELVRVELVETWECESIDDPEIPEIPDTPDVPVDPSDPCLCFARYWGDGPVYCFLESQFEAELGRDRPFWGADLADMAERGVPQCHGECSEAVPIGSPIVFDLDDNGIQLSRQHSISFDLAATGEKVRIAALTGADALLVLDLNHDGKIDSGAELFGNASECGERRCADGIEAISQYDDNRDGSIDAADKVFASLRLWQDADGDGIGQGSELRPLSSHAIERISLAARLDLAWTDRMGNSAVRSLDFERSDGRIGHAHDVWFALDFDSMPVNPRSSGITSSFAARWMR